MLLLPPRRWSRSRCSPHRSSVDPSASAERGEGKKKKSRRRRVAESRQVCICVFSRLAFRFCFCFVSSRLTPKRPRSPRGAFTSSLASHHGPCHRLERNHGLVWGRICLRLCLGRRCRPWARIRGGHPILALCCLRICRRSRSRRRLFSHRHLRWDRREDFGFDFSLLLALLSTTRRLDRSPCLLRGLCCPASHSCFRCWLVGVITGKT